MPKSGLGTHNSHYIGWNAAKVQNNNFKKLSEHKLQEPSKAEPHRMTALTLVPLTLIGSSSRLRCRHRNTTDFIYFRQRKFERAGSNETDIWSYSKLFYNRNLLFYYAVQSLISNCFYEWYMSIINVEIM
jgi:hypothetical protein